MGQCVLAEVFFPRVAKRLARGSFTKDANFRVFVVHIHRQVTQMLDHFLQILRGDIVDVEGNAFLAQRVIDLLAGARGDNAGQADTGAQKLHGNAHIHFCGPFMLVIGIHQDS